MSSPTGEQLSLSLIEKTLADDNPILLPLLAIFSGRQVLRKFP
jgi:hypothetical protein